MIQKIFPSIMAKNQEELDKDLKKLKKVVKTLHLDIVDGIFAPNETFQFPFKLSRDFHYRAHLMVESPRTWIAEHGRKIDLCIPHIGAVGDVAEYIDWMKKRKKKVAFAMKPSTSFAEIKPYLKKVDYVLILTVNPGFYGSKYLKSPLKKIEKIKGINPKIKIIVDGGMSPRTIKEAAKAGADFFVSGSFVTKARDPKSRIKRLLASI